jgi:hypothetical protein
MKNKLMRTTALVGSMIVLSAGISVAQTTVSGNLDLSYRAVENSKTPINSFRAFGKESQINIANKGKLTNGMDYAAGFSLEFDGADISGPTGSTTTVDGRGIHGEGVYINFTSGNTTLHIGADSIQNPDSHGLINPVGVGYITTYGLGTSGTQGIYPTDTNSPYGAYGFGLIQNVPNIGKVSAFYAPTDTNSQSGADIANTNTVAAYESNDESAYELGFVGDLGVKGLQVQAFYNKKDQPDGTSGDQKGTVLAASYNFGQVTLAAERRKFETTTDTVGRAASISFAATKELSLGLVYGKADISSGTVDEKIKIAAIGYNLGPVVINAEYTDTENLAGVATHGDSQEMIVKVSTKF